MGTTASAKLRVLLVEDNPGDVLLVRDYLSTDPNQAIELVSVPSLGAAQDAIAPDSWDLVLLDLGLPDGKGVDVVGAMRALASDVPIVVLTARADSGWAVEALRQDAQDYLVKDQLDGPSLHRSIRYAIERHRSQQHYREQLSASPDGMIVADHAGVVRFINAAAERLLGGTPRRVEELPERVRLPHDDAGDVILDTGHVVETRSVETMWQHEPACLMMLHDCTERHKLEESLSHLTGALTEANERLERLVVTDPLTEVLNRRGIEEALDKEVSRIRRTGDELTAVLIDFDDFKKVNESYGHAVGDATLRALTESISGALRAGDYISRVGGDEFLVLLPATGARVGLAVAEKLRRAIKGARLPVADRELRLSASLAVGGVGPHVMSLEEVLASVAGALRMSKEAGKDQVYTSESGGRRARSSPPFAMDVADIALETYLQEIRHTDSDEVVGWEALTRGPPGSLTMPTELFRTAFERNLLTTLDLRALAASLRAARQMHAHGWFHVNLFPSTIVNASVDRLLRLLDDAGWDGDVCVELSEQQFLGDPDYISMPLAALRAHGVRIALDDVGFGRSSIEALLVLEPSAVKVDRSCVGGIDKHRRRRRQLERLLAMIEISGATAIVEGVETRAELQVLRDMGVQYCQGYLWGPPAPVSRE